MSALFFAAAILIWSYAVYRMIWTNHRKGERLFYTYIGMWMLGPIPFGIIWLNAYVVNLSLISGVWLFYGFLASIFVVSFIGEIFKL